MLMHVTTPEALPGDFIQILPLLHCTTALRFNIPAVFYLQHNGLLMGIGNYGSKHNLNMYSKGIKTIITYLTMTYELSF